jgi:hypothetical protein
VYVNDILISRYVHMFIFTVYFQISETLQDCFYRANQNMLRGNKKKKKKKKKIDGMDDDQIIWI